MECFYSLLEDVHKLKMLKTTELWTDEQEKELETKVKEINDLPPDKREEFQNFLNDKIASVDDSLFKIFDDLTIYEIALKTYASNHGPDFDVVISICEPGLFKNINVREELDVNAKKIVEYLKSLNFIERTALDKHIELMLDKYKEMGRNRAYEFIPPFLRCKYKTRGMVCLLITNGRSSYCRGCLRRRRMFEI